MAFWKRKDDGVSYWYECSNCDGRPLLNEWNKQWEFTPYCPWCGEPMEEKENEVGRLQSGNHK